MRLRLTEVDEQPRGAAPSVATPAVGAPSLSQSALTLLRDTHRQRALALLRTDGPTSRAELARRLRLSPTTLTNLANALLETGTIIEIDPPDNGRRGRGRPGTLLALNSSAGAAAGIDFGHRRVQVTLANLAHQVLGSAAQSHAERAPWRRRVALAAELMQRLANEHTIALAALQGIGVGVVGPGDEHATRAEIVTTELRERFGVPVLVDNNTRLAALAETKWGVAAGLRNVLYIRLSQGVGGGLILDGRVFHGASGAAGEFGHICVDPTGPACWCGRQGCLESYVSVPALLAAWRPGQSATFNAFRQALNTGDPSVRALVASAGQRLGCVLAAVCNAVNPDDVVIGGELVAAGDALLGPTKAALQEHTLPITYRTLHLRTAQLGDDDGALGGIARVFRFSESTPGSDPRTDR